MGKIEKIVATASALVLLCTLIILPKATGEKQANAGGSGTPWCDRYGFIYSDGLDTWSGFSTPYGLHSGIYEYWGDINNPSVHYSICSHAPAWQGSAYYNKQYDYPVAYLNGNAMFIFFGHGERHHIAFTNGNSLTYIYDHPDNIP